MIQDIVNLLKRITLAHLVRYKDKDLSLIIYAIMNTVNSAPSNDDKLITRIENCLGLEYAPAGKEDALEAIQKFRDKMPEGFNVDFYIPYGEKNVVLLLRNKDGSRIDEIAVNDIIAAINY